MNATSTATRHSTATLAEVRAMAAWLAAHGFPVFPLTVGGKTPATRRGFKDAPPTPRASLAGGHARRTTSALPLARPGSV